MKCRSLHFSWLVKTPKSFTASSMKQQRCKKAEAQRTGWGPILCFAGFWSDVDLDTFIWPINMLVVPMQGQNHHCGSHERMKKSHQTLNIYCNDQGWENRCLIWPHRTAFLGCPWWPLALRKKPRKDQAWEVPCSQQQCKAGTEIWVSVS